MPGILTRKGAVAGVKPTITYPLTYQYQEATTPWAINPVTYEYEEALTGWTINPTTYEYQESGGWSIPPTVVEYLDSASWNLLAEPWWAASTFLLPFNTDFADISPNAMGAMTENGTPTIDTVTKKFGAGSASFDGSTDWLGAPDDAGLDLPGQFTLSAWVNLASKTWQTLIEIGQFNSGSGMLVRIGAGSGVTEVFVNGSVVLNGGTMTAGQWVHFMVTKDASNVMRMFFNGVLRASNTVASAVATTIGARIGRAKHNDADWLQGNMDDLSLVKDVCLFTDEFEPPTAELSSSFQFANIVAYQNNGGTGNRSSLGITMSTDLTVSGPIANLLDGVSDNSFYFVSTGDVTGNYIQADMGKDVIVTQWRLRSGGSQALGNWQPQYSDNGVDWTNCGSVQALGGNTTSRIDFDVAAAHRYYRLLGSSGSLSQTYNYELEFRIAPGF